MDTIRTFGIRKIDELIAGFEKALALAQKDQSEEPVHKLRVSIRRLQQGLRVFRQFVDKKASREIRAKLHDVMQLAGSLRERDIGMQLLTKASLPHDGIAEERILHGKQLSKAVTKLKTAKWRERLGVTVQ